MNFDQLIENIELTHDFFQARASKQVDENFTLRNWLIGFYLVEFEQNGQDRAIYGNKTIPTLVKKVAHIKGFSKRNFFLLSNFIKPTLQLCRQCLHNLQGLIFCLFHQLSRHCLDNWKPSNPILPKPYFLNLVSRIFWN